MNSIKKNKFLNPTKLISQEILAKEKKTKKWQLENKKFIEEHNKRIEKEGIFGEKYRCF